MQTLRNASFLARLVLAWFALSIGVAVASPLVKPVNVQWVCSVGGVIKMVAAGDDGALATPNPTLDCALCLVAGAPPQAGFALAAVETNSVQAPVSALPAPLAIRAAAPLPARGPPLSAAL